MLVTCELHLGEINIVTNLYEVQNGIKVDRSL